MARVLLAGESWTIGITHLKGYDQLHQSTFEIGCEDFLVALRAAGHEVTHLLHHEVPPQFPESIEELNEYDVVILSDIGSNSLLLHPDVAVHSRRRPNRLAILAEWVRGGGGLFMAGGYLSFQGFQGQANFHDTPIEEILPADLQPYDDRLEAPEGVQPELTSITHAITEGFPQTWPHILGQHKLTAKGDAQVLAESNGRPLLLTRQVGMGRTVALGTDIAPHWATPEFLEWDFYQTLCDRIVRWVAGDL